MLSCQCKTRNGSGVAHKRQRFGISQQKKSIWFFWFTMCRALYYFPPLSTPLIHVFSHPINGLAIFCLMHHPWIYVSSLLLLFFFTYKHLFDFVPLPLYCIFFTVRLRHHLYSYCHRLWTHSFCSPFCPLLPFNAFCLDFLTRHVYSLFTPQRIPKQSIPFI